MLAMATTSPTSIPVADRVHNFTYAIRNIVAEARAVEAAGKTVRYLNIGDPIPFGFTTPPALVEVVTQAMRDGAQRLRALAGHPPAREAVAQEWSGRGFPVVARPRADHGGHVRRHRAGADGAGEPGRRACWCRCRPTRSTRRCSPRSAPMPAYYRTDPARGWLPDLEHLESLITPRTRALVVIDPNNPTGAVYPTPIAARAARHRRAPRPGDPRRRGLRRSRLRRPGAAARQPRSRRPDHLVLEPVEGVSRARLAHRLAGGGPQSAARRPAGGDEEARRRAAVQQRARRSTRSRRRCSAIARTRSRSARRCASARR